MAKHFPASDEKDPFIGLASGLVAGVAGALVMTVFQDLLARGNITSGVSGRPSTEKAADILSKLATGHTLGRKRRPIGGEAVHYIVGGLVGGAYGLAAELEPRVTTGAGTVFGVAAATVVDETVVPATGLGDPFWRAPLASHPYSYASHAVFGASTEAARKLFRRFFESVKSGVAVLKRRKAINAQTDFISGEAHPVSAIESETSTSWRTLGLAFMMGATAGPRTSAPLLAVSWAARLGWIDLKHSPLAFIGTSKAVTVTTPMAIGEIVADKLPSTPSRTQPAGLIGRTATGALAGAAIAGGRSPEAALAGAAGAIAATYLGYIVRSKLAKAVGKDWPVAAVEDILGFGGAALVCLAALAPEKDTDELKAVPYEFLRS
jgi:uncharacterized membrane protein